jgi:hypothetical protein
MVQQRKNQLRTLLASTLSALTLLQQCVCIVWVRWRAGYDMAIALVACYLEPLS